MFGSRSVGVLLFKEFSQVSYHTIFVLFSLVYPVGIEPLATVL